MAGERLFRLRMRPGRALMTATTDGTEVPSASSGVEVVVEEKVAAFLVRQRAAEIIGVEQDPQAGKEAGTEAGHEAGTEAGTEAGKEASL